ncbi:DNA-directed RNA polymerase subunit alpha [Achromobacter phage Motura]|uniref:DNA-directed RNA polymerase subunit alpha n=1 Tax=Achromobacter phage Motura TaxID=2591403 RepID=A0A514CSJ0_9CAUD|nr:RNA polymerase sigma factor [Achromobacter phage Motura]QDH83442.1 DNA-directed RNA polymerase subunit alpha [Achromobacter phage Motura]
MAKYQHSETFRALKSTKEEIEGNLTSAQYLQTLDYFLWSALNPIAAECPDFFYSMIAKFVSLQTTKPNTKFTSGDKKQLPLILFNALINKNAEKRFESIKKMYWNRGLLFGLILTFQKLTNEYQALHSVFNDVDLTTRVNRMRQIEKSVGAKNPAYLYATIQQVAYWDSKARWFKSLIVQKFTRMAMLQAQQTYKDFDHKVPLDDVSHVYMMVVNKAIDRCNSNMGVITTFVQNWLPTARAIVQQMASKSTDESWDELAETLGDSLELGATMPNTDSETLQQISYLARLADPQGLVRTHLQIPQWVAAKYRARLLNLAKE